MNIFRKNSYLIPYLVLTVAYLCLAMLLPTNPETARIYHLTSGAYRVAQFAVALPLVIIWLTAFVGYAKLSEYSAAIKDSKEGPYFLILTRGIKWIAWGLPISSMVSLINNTIGISHPGYRSFEIIINHYLSLLISVVAFTLIGKATRGLIDSARLHLTLTSIRWLMASFIVLGVGFCYLTLRNIPNTSTANPYHLPVPLILITIVIPYLYAWFMGLLAAYEIGVYARHVKGVLYKQGLLFVSSGIVGIIMTSILLQYLTAVTVRLTHLTLNFLLVIIYLVLLLYAGGSISVAVGSARLKRIEEV